MAGAPIIWINSDKSEQVVYFNNEYVLITIVDMKKSFPWGNIRNC